MWKAPRKHKRSLTQLSCWHYWWFYPLQWSPGNMGNSAIFQHTVLKYTLCYTRSMSSCHLDFPCPSSCHSKDAQGCAIMSWSSVQLSFSLQLSFQWGSTKGQAHELVLSASLGFGSHSSKLIVCLPCHHYIDVLLTQLLCSGVFFCFLQFNTFLFIYLFWTTNIIESSCRKHNSRMAKSVTAVRTQY